MSQILVVGEDALCCALSEKLIAAALPSWTLAANPVNTRGITRFVPAIPRYADQAQHVQPVLCVADTDGRCAIDLLAEWVPIHAPTSLIVRLAVTEAESWVLADRSGFAGSFHIPLNKIPAVTDDIADPKRLLLNLVSRSRSRTFRDEMISATDSSKAGTGYNFHLCDFVHSTWDAQNAREHSPSLERALRRLESLGQQ